MTKLASIVGLIPQLLKTIQNSTRSSHQLVKHQCRVPFTFAAPQLLPFIRLNQRKQPRQSWVTGPVQYSHSGGISGNSQAVLSHWTSSIFSFRGNQRKQPRQSWVTGPVQYSHSKGISGNSRGSPESLDQFNILIQGESAETAEAVLNHWTSSIFSLTGNQRKQTRQSWITGPVQYSHSGGISGNSRDCPESLDQFNILIQGESAETAETVLNHWTSSIFSFRGNQRKPPRQSWITGPVQYSHSGGISGNSRGCPESLDQFNILIQGESAETAEAVLNHWTSSIFSFRGNLV